MFKTENELVNYKKRNELVQLTIIIEVNRILQDISIKELCKDSISVSQYETFLTGDIQPTRDIAMTLLNKLGILYFEDRVFLDKTEEMIVSFVEEHMFNEFDQALWRFTVIEANEEQILSSPLVVEYLITKLAYYAIHDREVYTKTRKILKTIKPLMTRDQKFLYNLYQGIDAFKIRGDIDKAKEYFKKTRDHGGHPHVYTWIGISELFKGRVVRAMRMFEKAQRRYMNDGNLTGLIFASELFGLTYYRENDYSSGIDVLYSALKHSKTISREHLIVNFKNQIAWGYYRQKEYQKALDMLTRDRYNNDYTVNSSVTKFLIGYELGDAAILAEVKEELENRNKTLHRMLYTIVSEEDFIDENGEIRIEEEDILSMIHMSKMTHFELEKAFTDMLVNYYMKNNEYEKLANHFRNSLDNQVD